MLDGDLPLQPRRQLSGDLRYLGDGVDLRAAVRWVDDLDLLSVDTVLNVPIDDRWTLRFEALDLLNERRVETLGGDSLRRRLSVAAVIGW